MSSVALSSSTASSLSTLPPKDSVAVLVRGPEFRREEKDVIAVEPARCTSIDLSESPRREKIPVPIPAILQAMFRGVNISESLKQEEHEMVEHPNVRTYFDHEDISRDYGYKYEFCDDDDNDRKPSSKQETTDGNCLKAAAGDAEFDGNESDYDESDDNNESLLSQAAYSPLRSADQLRDTNQIDIGSLPTSQLFDVDADPRIYLLGKVYDVEHQYEQKRDEELSLFWFTYRSGFPEISPYGISSDAGWGCMLRSAQMMLAQALRVHFKSREWRSHRFSISQRRREPFLRSLLTWMADFPSASDNVYSLHNMVAAGMAKYEILPGEWYGPSTACHVVRDLVQAHEMRQVALWKKKKHQQEQERQQDELQKKAVASDNEKKTATPLSIEVPDKPIRVFRVYVASQSTVYYDDVRDLMTKESRAEYEASKLEAANGTRRKKILDHPLEDAEEELKEGQRERMILNQLEWDTGLLLLIPLRLGLKNGINEEYTKSIAYTFSIPYSVGVLGGRPRGARWFYGAWSDGSKILGLDPHTVQEAPRRRTARINGKAISVVDISESYLRSVHTACQEAVPLVRVDPSIALGFYCRSAKELHHLHQLVRGWTAANPSLPDIFSFAESSPDYGNGNMISSSMIDDMMAGDIPGGSSLLDGEDSDEVSDEEYVML